MKSYLRRLPLFLLSAVVTTGGGAGSHVFAQGNLHVYGSEGPAPAINEAAAVFAERSNLKVDVVSGPTVKWVDRARRDADLIYSSAEFMMSGFLRDADLQVDPESVTPLYLRPSAILVRPGNPKRIEDFPDLLRSGMRVMVVNGSGQVGLWEDMAGKQGDIRTVREFRKNVVVFATSSEEALRTWREREDLDAWVTWNIWLMPLRDEAKLVEVGRDYRVYRQCSIALTQRGRRKPEASRFIEFLLSAEGESIFESWGWMTTPKSDSPLAVHNDIAVVCRIDTNKCKDNVGLGLVRVRELLRDYEAINVPLNEVHITAVIHGDAAHWMLRDEAYRAYTKTSGANPNRAIIRELRDLRVGLELCGRTMKEHGWTAEDVLPDVKILPNADPRIIDLELQGYAYIRF